MSYRTTTNYWCDFCQRSLGDEPHSNSSPTRARFEVGNINEFWRDMAVTTKLLRKRVPCRRCAGVGTIPVYDGEKLRALREKAGLSLRALASRLGLSHVYLSDIEHNRRGVSDAQVARIIAAIEAKS